MCVAKSMTIPNLSLSALREDVHVRPVDVARHPPPVEVIVGEALVGERHELIGAAGPSRDLEGVEAGALVAAGPVALVQLLAPPELGAHRVPQQLQQLDAV